MAEHRVVIGIALAGAAGILLMLWLDRSPDSPAPQPPAPEISAPKPPSTPLEPAPTPPEREPRPPVAVDPAPSEPDPRHQTVHVVGDRGVAKLTLSVGTFPEPSRLIRVKIAPDLEHYRRQWEALVHLATFAALDVTPDVQPRGLRVQLDVGMVGPNLAQVAPLTLAIRTAARGLVYPQDVLVAGLVCPDGTLLELDTRARYERMASSAGLAYAHGVTVDHLLVQWGLQRRDSPAPRAKPATGPRPFDLDAVDLDAVRGALREVVGAVHAKHPARLPAPEDWRELISRVEGRLQTARVRGLDELVTLGVAAARIRDGAQLVRWASDRVLGFSQRMIRDETALSGWPMGWLSALVVSRVDGERAVRDWLRVLPPSSERPRLVKLPAAWLRARAERLRALTEHLSRLFELRVARGRELPRPYPYHDVRALAWARQGPKLTRAAAADWGHQLSRVGRMWAQLVIVARFAPERTLTTTEPNAVLVSDRAGLDALVRQIRRQVEATGSYALTGEGHLLTEVRRVLAAVPPDGLPDATGQVEGLERLWQAVTINLEARLLRRHLGTEGRR